MEVLVKLPNNIAWNGVIKASKGRVWLKERVSLRVERIYGVYEGPDGLYVAYHFDDPAEILDLTDFVAQRPVEVRPASAKVRVFKYALCDGERFDEMVDDDCSPVYDYAEIPPRELPSGVVTRENLRDLFVKSFDFKTALAFGDKIFKVVSQMTLRRVPLCDESGEAKIGHTSLDYCRIGNRLFIKRWREWPYYEVPPEWSVEWEVVERREHPGAEGLRHIFGLEANPEELIAYVARQLGLDKYEPYVHVAKYCIAPAMEWPRHQYLDRELYGGIVKVYRPYRLYYGDYDCVDEPSPYALYVVVCTALNDYRCKAWRARAVGPEDPPDVIAGCIYSCQCSHELLQQLDGDKRKEVLRLLEEELRYRLEREDEFERVKCFPLEIISGVLGPVTSYEEAEVKWSKAVEEVEKKKEEERRRLEEEEMRKREERRREILDRVKRLGLPLKVEVKDYAVYVAFARRLPNDEFQRAIKALKELGFKFDWRDKVWYYEL